MLIGGLRVVKSPLAGFAVAGGYNVIMSVVRVFCILCEVGLTTKCALLFSFIRPHTC